MSIKKFTRFIGTYTFYENRTYTFFEISYIFSEHAYTFYGNLNYIFLNFKPSMGSYTIVTYLSCFVKTTYMFLKIYTLHGRSIWIKFIPFVKNINLFWMITPFCGNAYTVSEWLLLLWITFFIKFTLFMGYYNFSASKTYTFLKNLHLLWKICFQQVYTLF